MTDGISQDIVSGLYGSDLCRTCTKCKSCKSVNKLSLSDGSA